MIWLHSFLLRQKLSRRGFLVLATKTGITQIKSSVCRFRHFQDLVLVPHNWSCGQLAYIFSCQGVGNTTRVGPVSTALKVAPNSRIPRRSSVDCTKGKDRGAHLSPFCWRTQWTESSLVWDRLGPRVHPCLAISASLEVGILQSESSHGQGLGGEAASWPSCSPKPATT